ncbi:uncharacterized protein LOC129777905 [Toxorhynchites rutilus septentrionalis]|uniref:uncharacterized protein LOC129777905 n=1 Tax=Toxorhynchites rutilus septentrionalis TaxID=329112 RepID=UPI00247A77BC|nr:uncharacterized protein LOC129777905 [Toxorhynchites rutilus septentrionalis]
MNDMFEEVIVDEQVASYEETEYLVDEEEKPIFKRVEMKFPRGLKLKKGTGQFVKLTSVMPSNNVKAFVNKSDELQIPVKKVPIVRKPGEIVTPIHLRKLEPGKVSPPIKKAIVVTPKVKTEWTRVAAPGAVSTPKQLLTRRLEPEPEPEPDPDGDEQFDVEEEGQDDGIDEVSQDMIVSDNMVSSSTEQLSRIEKKMDLILSKLNEHDGALKLLKYNINDLRTEMRNSTKISESVYETQAAPIKRERKRTVVFPIPDDNYLFRLEELSLADDEIRNELVDLFNDAPDSSIYEYMRKNAYSLFENTSKYTWTGKPSNSLPSMPASNPACKLHLVELLISCGCDKFHNSSRDNIEKEFRRALNNFNDTKYAKRKRKLEKDKQMMQFDV